VLLTFLAFLVIVSLWRVRADQRRWQEAREELHRVEMARLDQLGERLERVEKQVDRIVPVAKIVVKPPAEGGLEVKHEDWWETSI
jgi:hypothetical protein